MAVLFLKSSICALWAKKLCKSNIEIVLRILILMKVCQVFQTVQKAVRLVCYYKPQNQWRMSKVVVTIRVFRLLMHRLTVNIRQITGELSCKMVILFFDSNIGAFWAKKKFCKSKKIRFFHRFSIEMKICMNVQIVLNAIEFVHRGYFKISAMWAKLMWRK